MTAATLNCVNAARVIFFPSNIGTGQWMLTFKGNHPLALNATITGTVLVKVVLKAASHSDL